MLFSVFVAYNFWEITRPSRTYPPFSFAFKGFIRVFFFFFRFFSPPCEKFQTFLFFYLAPHIHIGLFPIRTLTPRTRHPSGFFFGSLGSTLNHIPTNLLTFCFPLQGGPTTTRSIILQLFTVLFPPLNCN